MGSEQRKTKPETSGTFVLVPSKRRDFHHSRGKKGERGWWGKKTEQRVCHGRALCRAGRCREREPRARSGPRGMGVAEGGGGGCGRGGGNSGGGG